MKLLHLPVLTSCAVTLLLPAAALTQTATVTPVHTFAPPSQTVSVPGGTVPTSIIQASDGNLWGTTAQGGMRNDGTIFKIQPDGTYVTVFDFVNAVGPYNIIAGSPVGLIEGSDGNFYGLTQTGGDGFSYDDREWFCLCGITFQLTPQGQFAQLYSFGDIPNNSNDVVIFNETPNPGLIAGSDGNLYGTDLAGVVFTVNGSQLLAYGASPSDLAGYNESYALRSTVIQHTNGLFYGTANTYEHTGVYSYSPQQQALNFYSSQSVQGLGSALAEGTDGNLYGGGTNFLLRFPPSGPPQFFPTNFSTATGLISASDGNIYGVSGSSTSSTGSLLFNITPTGVIRQFPVDTWQLPALTYSVSPIQAADGSFLLPVSIASPAVNGIYRYTLSPALPPPIQITATPATIALGSSITLDWQVLNATSLTMQQCNAFPKRPGTGYGGNWTGPQTGTYANGIYSGSATVTPTAGGTYTYALTCGGVESGFATVTVTGGTTSGTTTQVSSSVSSVAAGTPIPLSAQVASTTGGYAPTGTVTFLFGNRTIGTATLNTNDIANLTTATTNLPGGNYAITARYNGDANDTSSTSAPFTVAVQGVVTAHLVISPATIAPGGSITFTATLRQVHGGPVPTGDVFFESPGTYPAMILQDAALDSSGVATVTTTLGQDGDPPPNAYPVTAYYYGDTYSQPATTSPVTVTVTAASNTVLHISPISVTNGQTLSLIADVSATNHVNSGTVAFTSGSRTIATTTVNSGIAAASVLVQNIPPGTYPITANFLGNGVDLPSTSVPVSLTITQ